MVVEELLEHGGALVGEHTADDLRAVVEAPIADQGLANPLDIPVALHIHSIAIPYMGLPLLDNAQQRQVAA